MIKKIPVPSYEGQYTPEGRNALKVGIISDNLSHLMGEILTVIDASITEPVQNKAIKDLIKDKINKKQEWFGELAWKKADHSYELKENAHNLFPSDGVFSWQDKLVPFDPNVGYVFEE